MQEFACQVLKKGIILIFVFLAGFAAGLLFRSEPDAPAPAENITDPASDDPALIRGEKQPDTPIKKVEKEAAPPEKVEESSPTPDSIEPVREDTAVQSAASDTAEAVTDTAVTADVQAPDDTITLPEFDEMPGNNDEITLDRDELAGVLNLNISHIVQPEPREQDTLAERILRTQSDIKTADEKQYRVEYWQSPFNVRGYKMGNNKLVLYGADIDQNAKLIEFNDSLYFRNFNDIYHLRPTFSLRPLKTIDSTHAAFGKLTDELDRGE